MRIGIFVLMAGRQAGGPETYEHSLVRSIAALDQHNEYHIYCPSRAAAESFRIDQPNVHYRVLWPSSRWVSIPGTLPLSLLANRIDLCHVTFAPPPFSPVDYVFTMHCFSNFVDPTWYPPRILDRLNRLVLKGIRKAKLIICVSENVRDLTAERFGVPSERLAVVYHGVGESFRPLPEDEVRPKLQARYGLRDPYVLFVGKPIARKNIVRIFESFHRFRESIQSEMKLVLVGRRTWEPHVIDESIDRLGLREHVIEIGHLHHDDLPLVYNGAEMLLFPSLWEGFGIPIIEAMACGTPVITSDISCIPEVCGGAALLIDPLATDEIVAAMHKVHTDASVRDSLREKGIARAKDFTWKRAAQQTISAYERVATL